MSRCIGSNVNANNLSLLGALDASFCNWGPGIWRTHFTSHCCAQRVYHSVMTHPLKKGLAPSEWHTGHNSMSSEARTAYTWHLKILLVCLFVWRRRQHVNGSKLNTIYVSIALWPVYQLRTVSPIISDTHFAIHCCGQLVKHLAAWL